MALHPCKECGVKISDDAKACPQCGAKQPQGIGFFTFAAGIIVFAVVLASLTGGFGGGSAANTNDYAAATKAAKRNKCTADLASMRGAYDQQFAAENYAAAQQAFGECTEVLADPAIVALIAQAQFKVMEATANDPKAPLAQRVAALEFIDNNYRNEAPKYAALLADLGAKHRAIKIADEKKAEAADRARRRKEGVRIGMTPEEVRMSMWGKPRKINRSTYSFGVHEQWVYDGGYLYFEDDKLTSIQN